MGIGHGRWLDQGSLYREVILEIWNVLKFHCNLNKLLVYLETYPLYIDILDIIVDRVGKDIEYK